MEAATLTPLARGKRDLAADETLVAATRAGDDRAFETLYHRYHRRIAAYVLGMVKDHQRAEDVTQDVFMSALRRMRATDSDLVFKPWIYEIAKNACIDQFRRSKRADEVSYDADGEEGGVPPLVSGGPAPDTAVHTRQQLDDLCGAFGGLSESHHRILVLRELEGRSYNEIGERMGMTRPAVESTLFRARKRLGEEYGELISGERCLKVQSIIATAGESALGSRDKRTMARHVSHCQPCRRAAGMAGLQDLVPARTGVRSKIAAFLPLPAALRDRWLGVGSHHAASSADAGGGSMAAGLAGWLHAAAPMAESASGWTKAAAAAVTVAVAGVGASAITGVGPVGGGSGDDRMARSAPAVTSPAAGTKSIAALTAGGGTILSTANAPSGASGAAGGARRPGRASAQQSVPAAGGTDTSGVAGSGTVTGAPKSDGASAPAQTTAGTTADPAGGVTNPTGAVGGDTTTSATGTVGDTTTSATDTVGNAGPTVTGTANGVGTAVQEPSTPSIPSVGDTAPTVPVQGDVTTAVEQTADETLTGVQGAVDDVAQGIPGTGPGLGNLSPGG